MKLNLLFLTTCLFFIHINNLLPPRLFFYFHGFGSNCEYESVSLPGICIETGADFDSLKSLKEQAFEGCLKITEEIFNLDNSLKIEFKYGFYLSGTSQGGIIVRLIYKNCHQIKKYVVGIITNGTPNLGISKLPDIENTGFGGEWYSGFVSVAKNIVECYIKTFVRERDISIFQYLNGGSKKATMIESLLNESENDYSDLEVLVSILYTNDDLIEPHSSQTFGVDFDVNNNKWEYFPHSKYAQNNGMLNLWNQNRMWNCRSVGGHLRMNDQERRTFEYFYHDYCKNYDLKPTIEETMQEYRKCSDEKLKRMEIKGLICDQTQKMEGLFDKEIFEQEINSRLENKNNENQQIINVLHEKKNKRKRIKIFDLPETKKNPQIIEHFLPKPTNNVAFNSIQKSEKKKIKVDETVNQKMIYLNSLDQQPKSVSTYFQDFDEEAKNKVYKPQYFIKPQTDKQKDQEDFYKNMNTNVSKNFKSVTFQDKSLKEKNNINQNPNDIVKLLETPIKFQQIIVKKANQSKKEEAFKALI